MSKKLVIFLRLYWLHFIGIVLFGVLLYYLGTFIHYGFTNYMALEGFTRRQLAGSTVMMLPTFLLVQILSLPFIFLMQYYLVNGTIGKFGIDKVGKAKVNVKWDEVIGMDSAKKEAWEIVKLLKDRHLLKIIGGKIIKGTMMIGPPGCGKTYLAKAIATECGLPLLSAVGSEFVGMFVGQGAAQMKQLFKQARALADLEGGCIIFIDEIDSFARPRQVDRGFGGGTNDHNATINQFLTELDGLRQKENNVVVIAATNVPENELDSAIMRAGRFDRKIYVGKPNLSERKELFKFYLSRVSADANVSPDILARKTLWFTPSDIDSMVREAGIIALREKRTTLTMKDLSEAYDRVSFGDKSNIIMTQEDKVWTAYHEAGHAILAYLVHPKDDIIKATIIPRKGALGFISHRPGQESYSYNREYFLAQIKIAIASYAAERIKFGSTSSGVGGGPGADFHTALKIAESMVWSYGMGQSGLIGDFSHSQLIGGKTRETLDADVQEILQTCLKDVTDILTQHKDLFEYFSQELLKKEELEYDEIQAIFDKFNVKPLSGRSPLSA